MTDTEDPGVLDDEAVGSVAEEAAKLISALSGWAREHGDGLQDGLTQGMSAIADELHQHIDTGAPECTWCPVCRAVSLVRHTSPEVKAHLASAASSLALAVSSLLATRPPSRDGEGRVERIRLDDEVWSTTDAGDVSTGDEGDSWTEGGES